MLSKLVLNKRRKQLMKANIIRHQRRVCYYLEKAFGTNLKPRVNSSQNELLNLDMFYPDDNKQESKADNKYISM